VDDRFAVVHYGSQDVIALTGKPFERLAHTAKEANGDAPSLWRFAVRGGVIGASKASSEDPHLGAFGPNDTMQLIGEGVYQSADLAERLGGAR
jgi:hypothetical protein